MSGGDCLGSLTTFRSPQSDYEIRSTSAIQVFYVYLLYQISAVRSAKEVVLHRAFD